MSSLQSPSPTGFTLYDILTRITPGILFLSILTGTTIDIEILLVYSGSNLLPIFTLFAGFLIGEAIDTIRMSEFAAPKTFRYILFNERENNRDTLTLFDRLRVRIPLVSIMPPMYRHSQTEFWPEFKRRFNVTDDLTDSNEIYLRLCTHLDSRFTPITRRYQSITVFVQNLWISLALSSFFALFSLIVDGGPSDEWKLTVLVITLMFWMFVSMFNTAEQAYVRLLFVTFSVENPSSGGDQSEQSNLHDYRR